MSFNEAMAGVGVFAAVSGMAIMKLMDCIFRKKNSNGYDGPERRTCLLSNETDRDDFKSSNERSRRIEKYIEQIIMSQTATSQHLLEIAISFKGHISDGERNIRVLEDSLKRIEHAQGIIIEKVNEVSR